MVRRGFPYRAWARPHSRGCSKAFNHPDEGSAISSDRQDDMHAPRHPMQRSSVPRALAAKSATRSPRVAIVIGLAIALALLTALRPVFAQKVNFRHYTTSEGLPQSQVRAIQQDRFGYMWFATYGGLTSFNGREFRSYTKDDGLSSNSVIDIAQDHAGQLLLATSRGLCVMANAHFSRFSWRHLGGNLRRRVVRDPHGDSELHHGSRAARRPRNADRGRLERPHLGRH
jgi:hypothetical protein